MHTTIRYLVCFAEYNCSATEYAQFAGSFYYHLVQNCTGSTKIQNSLTKIPSKLANSRTKIQNFKFPYKIPVQNSCTKIPIQNSTTKIPVQNFCTKFHTPVQSTIVCISQNANYSAVFGPRYSIFGGLKRYRIVVLFGTIRYPTFFTESDLYQ